MVKAVATIVAATIVAEMVVYLGKKGVTYCQGRFRRQGQSA